MDDDELEEDEMFWHSDNRESRVEAIADVWDEYAEEFFADRGWEKDHISYSTDSPDARRTGTLWVQTRIDMTIEWGGDQTDNIAWEDTGIPAREADSLLCDGWDNAETEAYDRWRKENGFPSLWGEEE